MSSVNNILPPATANVEHSFMVTPWAAAAMARMMSLEADGPHAACAVDGQSEPSPGKNTSSVGIVDVPCDAHADLKDAAS